MSSESDLPGIEVIQFIVGEFHDFFGELKIKLANMEATVGNGKSNTNGKANTNGKSKRTNKVKRSPSAFNIFVKEELLKHKGEASTAPEGTNQGTWRMSNAAKKWGTLTPEQKKAFAESKKDLLMNSPKALEDSSPDDAETPAKVATASEEAVEVAASQPTSTDKKKKKKKRDRESEVGAAGEATPGAGEEGVEKKKKKKKKAEKPAAEM